MPLIPNQKIVSLVLYEDEALLVVEKPAGSPVYPLDASETDTIANGLVAAYPDLINVGKPLQAGIIHRLDNDTSGLLVAAKNNQVYEKLCSAWNTEVVQKEYTALVIGKTPEKGRIKGLIDHHPRKKKKMIVATTGRAASTSFVREQYFNEGYSLLTVQIKTGVRHQIRVHLASIGHPIVGDRLYQNPMRQKLDQTGLRRQFLHLGCLSFEHPMTHKAFEVFSELPIDLAHIFHHMC